MIQSKSLPKTGQAVTIAKAYNLCLLIGNEHYAMRILLIEDNNEIAHFLYTSLTEACYVVDVAGDGLRGSYLGTSQEYDIIILDYNLPKKKAPEVCKEIRAAGKTCPILILSVEHSALKKVELLNMGADDYMTKPFSLEELLARLRVLQRRPSAISAETLGIDDLTINLRTHNVERNKKEIYLTKKEFMLLEYMIKNQDAVLSRGKILEHVWDINADIFSNTIETHILTLRKKIEFDGKKKLIHTVPGRGYKLAVKK